FHVTGVQTCALPIFGDDAFADALVHPRLAAGARNGDRAAKPGPAFLWRYPVQKFQQQLVVGRVRSPRPGETGRVNARPAAESVDLQPRIIRDGPVARVPRG